MGDKPISSEVLEVLSVSADVADSYRMDPASTPKTGDYYLSLLGSIRFRLVDAKIGKLIATERSPREWPVVDMIADDIRVPVRKGDVAAYAKYFRSVDFTPQALDSLKKVLPSVLPSSHQVAVEK